MLLENIEKKYHEHGNNSALFSCFGIARRQFSAPVVRYNGEGFRLLNFDVHSFRPVTRALAELRGVPCDAFVITFIYIPTKSIVYIKPMNPHWYIHCLGTGLGTNTGLQPKKSSISVLHPA